MFSTTGQVVKKNLSKGFNAGVVKAHIYDAIVRTSSTGKKQLQFILEGPAIAGFEGWDKDRTDASKGKFLGQSSMVSATIYMDETKFGSSDLNVNEIVGKMVYIADELGLREGIDKIAAGTVEEWVAAATAILKGKDLFFFLGGTEELYNGKVRVKLQLPKFKYASIKEGNLDEFDKTNKYHWKGLPKTDGIAGGDAIGSDPVTDFDAVPFDVN